MITTKDWGKQMIETDRKQQLGEALTIFLFCKRESPSDRWQAHWEKKAMVECLILHLCMYVSQPP